MFLRNGDLSDILLAKHSTQGVVACKLISFHGLKSGEPDHLLCFYLSFYKEFMSDHLCLMPGWFFFQVASCSLFWVSAWWRKDMESGFRLVAVEPETMPMVVQIKLTTKQIHKICPPLGWKLSSMKISNTTDMLIFICFKVRLKWDLWQQQKLK